MRSTLAYWVTCCPECGYCAPDLSEASPEASAVVKSEAYKALRADRSLPEMARDFLAYSAILERVGLLADAGWSALHAAWACDDEDAVGPARDCRRKAIEFWRGGKMQGQPFSENLWGEFAIITDVYRRTGAFEEARTACEEGLDEIDIPQPVEAMLRRQLVLIQQRDDTRHSMKELPSAPEGGQRVVLH